MNIITLFVVILVVLIVLGLPQVGFGYSRYAGGGYVSPVVLLVILLLVLLFR